MGIFKRVNALEDNFAKFLLEYAKDKEEFDKKHKRLVESHSLSVIMLEEMKKKLKETEKMLADAKSSLDELEKKLPEYSEAVSKGVDDVWNATLRSVADFDPYTFLKPEGGSK